MFTLPRVLASSADDVRTYVRRQRCLELDRVTGSPGNTPSPTLHIPPIPHSLAPQHSK